MKEAVCLHILIFFLSCHFHFRKLKAIRLFFFFLKENLGERWLCLSDWSFCLLLPTLVLPWNIATTCFVILFKMIINKGNIDVNNLQMKTPNSGIWFSRILLKKKPSCKISRTVNLVFPYSKKKRCESAKIKRPKFQLYSTWKSLNACRNEVLF